MSHEGLGAFVIQHLRKTEPRMKLFIVSGRSGAGKTIALRVLEDLGYYCVDNLPVTFFT